MNLNEIIFYAFVLVAAFSAVTLVFTRHLLYGIVALLLTLLSVAAIFVMLGAEFLAITQILVYAGGVVVLLLFGIMLTHPVKGEALVVLHQYQSAAMLLGASFFALMVMTITRPTGAEVLLVPTMQDIGKQLMTRYVWPFELSGLLLLICLIASAFAATAHKKKS